MSNIDKQALRDIAAAAVSTPLWYAVGIFGEVVDPANPEWKPVHDFCKTFTAERVLALLDELEESERLRMKFQGANCELCQKLESAEKTSAARLGAIDTTHKMFQRERDRAEAAENLVAELSHHLQCAHAFVEQTEAFGHAASNGILCCGDAQWNIDASKSALAAAGKGE